MTYPTYVSTNYMIVLVNTRTPFFADATDKLLPSNRLPIRCLNEKGLVLKLSTEITESSEENWVLLNNSATAHSKNMINITIDSSTLNLKTKVSIIQREYEAYTTRKNYRDDKEDLKEFYKDYVGDISLLVTRGYDKLDGVYSINMKSDFETEFIGENILVKPFLNIPIDYEVLKEDTRKYPVDFTYSWNDEFQSIINVPTDYTVSTLPEPLNIDNESVSINLSYSYKNNKLTAIGQYAF